MKPKKYILIMLLAIFSTCSAVMLVNYVVDPSLNFNQSANINLKISQYNEREQKTNYLYNTDKRFDSILLGSSRGRLINSLFFKNDNVFNYAVSSAKPYEYQTFIDFFIKTNDIPNNIVIGIDFFGYLMPFGDEKPETYVYNTTNRHYKYKQLLSIDMFLQSLKTIRNSSKDNITYLSRNMESIHEVYNHEKKKSSYQSSLFSYAKDYINIHIVNHKSYVKILKELKNLNSSSNLIVYTTPVSADHFAMKMKSMDKYALYSQWIKTLVDIFGEIYCFMGINSVTNNIEENYYDSSHAYSHVGKIIAHKLETKDFNSEPSDFGVIVNKNNVGEFLKMQEEQIQNYEFSEYYPKEKINRLIQEHEK